MSICLNFLTPQVAAGGTHSVVLTQEGHVWTWGQPWPPGDMYVPSTKVCNSIFVVVLPDPFIEAS